MSIEQINKESAEKIANDFPIKNGKQTKTPRNYDSILKGALGLSLKERVELKKELAQSIQEEVTHLQIMASDAAKISQE